MSGAIPLLRLYAFMEWTEATSEDFDATKKKKKVGCSLHMLRNMIYIFLLHVSRNYRA